MFHMKIESERYTFQKQFGTCHIPPRIQQFGLVRVAGILFSEDPRPLLEVLTRKQFQPWSNTLWLFNVAMENHHF